MLCQTEQQLEKVKSSLSKASRIAFDVETTSVYSMDAELVAVQVGWEIAGSVAVAYIPVGHKVPTQPKAGHTPGAPEWYPDGWEWALVAPQVSMQAMVEFLAWLLFESEADLYIHNARYEWVVLKQMGLEIPGHRIVDTMIVAAAYDSSRHHGLKELVKDWLGVEMQNIDLLLKYKLGNKNMWRTFDQVPLTTAVPYGEADVAHLFALHDYCWNRLSQQQRKVYMEIEKPLVEVCAFMQWQGVPVDREFLTMYQGVLHTEMGKQVEIVKAIGMAVVGWEVWLNSDQQMSALFEKLGVPFVELGIGQVGREGGKYWSMTLSNLHTIAVKCGGVAKVAAEASATYRQYAKQSGTYVSAYLNYHINKITGRVHGTLDQRGTVTGRLSSYGPNLQNLATAPVGGYAFRDAIRAPQGYKLVSIDYSQIEPRVLASVCGDSNMIQAFLDGHDFYKAASSALFNIPIEEVTSAQRSVGKTCTLAAIYGSGPGNMVYQTGCTWNEARSHMERFFSQYSRIRLYHEYLMDQVRNSGYVETLLGRQRALNRADPPYTVVVNTPIQGTAADLIKLAMRQVYDYCRQSPAKLEMILSVHDEIVFLIPEQSLHLIQDLVDIMEGVGQPYISVPLRVEAVIGDTWQLGESVDMGHTDAIAGLECL